MELLLLVCLCLLSCSGDGKKTDHHHFISSEPDQCGNMLDVNQAAAGDVTCSLIIDSFDSDRLKNVSDQLDDAD